MLIGCLLEVVLVLFALAVEQKIMTRGEVLLEERSQESKKGVMGPNKQASERALIFSSGEEEEK